MRSGACGQAGVPHAEPALEQVRERAHQAKPTTIPALHRQAQDRPLQRTLPGGIGRRLLPHLSAAVAVQGDRRLRPSQPGEVLEQDHPRGTVKSDLPLQSRRARGSG
jgi:hypothetical protein